MIQTRKLLSQLSVVLAVGLLVVSPAHADVGSIATSVLQELLALVRPAVMLGVIWLGVLIITNRGTLITFLTFLCGVAIVASGGIW